MGEDGRQRPGFRTSRESLIHRDALMSLMCLGRTSAHKPFWHVTAKRRAAFKPNRNVRGIVQTIILPDKHMVLIDVMGAKSWKCGNEDHPSNAVERRSNKTPAKKRRHSTDMTQLSGLIQSPQTMRGRHCFHVGDKAILLLSKLTQRNVRDTLRSSETGFMLLI